MCCAEPAFGILLFHQADECAYVVGYNLMFSWRKSSNLLSSWLCLLLQEGMEPGVADQALIHTVPCWSWPIICLVLGGQQRKVQFSSKDLLQQLVTFLETRDASSVGSVQVTLCTL